MTTPAPLYTFQQDGGQLVPAAQLDYNFAYLLSLASAAQSTLQFASIAALQSNTFAVPSGTYYSVTVAAYTGGGTTGGGVFVNGPSATANGGTTFNDAGGNTWYRLYNGLIDPRWFGAVADGVTDTAAKLTAADSIGPILLSGGTYAVASSIGLGNEFQTDGTGILKPANGFQITFNKTFSASLAQAFSNATAGLGSVAFGTTTPAVYPQWWGAVAGGGDCSAALVAAAASGLPVVIVNGVFTVSASVTVPAPITILPQASFSVSSGNTLTFGEIVAMEWGAQFTGAGNVALNGGFTAPLTKVFNVTGTVSLSPQYTFVGYPEWWGAITNSSGADNRNALNACIAACAVTQLQAADYWIQGTWNISTSQRTILGVGFNANGSAPATRVLLASATLDVCLLGLASYPGSIAGFVALVTLQNITFYSTVAPTAPSSGIQGGPSCLRVQYAQNCDIQRCFGYNATNGFYFYGVVATTLKDCQAQRLLAGTTVGNDYFLGCMLDGTPSIGTNTGIASVYVDHLSIIAGAQLGSSNGVYTYNGFTDIFVEKVETSQVNVGLNFNGHPSVMYSSEDLHVTNCVLDQVNIGIILNAGEDTTGAVLVNNYVGLTSAGSSTGISVTSTPISGIGGAISLIGNQIIAAGGATIGLSVSGSTGVIGLGNIYTDCNNPIVLATAGNVRLADRISNPTQTGTAAIKLTAASRTVIDCTVNGASGAFTYGVDMVGAANTYDEIRCSGIDPTCITGGSANKLVSNGTQITTAGTFATNCLAQGIMA